MDTSGYPSMFISHYNGHGIKLLRQLSSSPATAQLTGEQTNCDDAPRDNGHVAARPKRLSRLTVLDVTYSMKKMLG